MSSDIVRLYQNREQLLMRLAELSARQLQLDDEKALLAANQRQLVAALQDNSQQLHAVMNTSSATAEPTAP